jgi:hypothetical protein
MGFAGKRVIRKKTRPEHELRAGANLDLRCGEGTTAFQSKSTSLLFAHRGEFVVAVLKKRHRKAFAAETVETILNAIREERV